MVSHPLCGRTPKSTGYVAGSGIDETDRHALTRDPERQCKVAVVRDDNCCVDIAGEHVYQEVGRNIDVAPLLFQP